MSISINTLDLQSTSAVNMPTSMAASESSAASSAAAVLGGSSLILPSSSTYRVNNKGEIEIPLIGKIKAEGLTTSTLKDTIQLRINQFYKMPTVDVRYANFKVTVLGEVFKPGTYTVPNEKVTILDALGLSGDLTIFGKRENVLLIRDSSDKKVMVRMNLNSNNIISSPYYYLKQNDIVYVEPRNEKIAILDAVQTKYIGIASAVLSLLVILATRIK